MPHQGSLFALAQAGSLAFEPAQVIQLGAAHAAGSDKVDVIDHWRVDREDALNALAETDLANGNGLAQAAVLTRDYGAFESLQTLLVALANSDVHADGVAWAEFRYVLTLVRVLNLIEQSILHGGILWEVWPQLGRQNPYCTRSGRFFAVFSRAACWRQRRISAWLPPRSTSGTLQPRNSAGRVYCGQSSSPSCVNDS